MEKTQHVLELVKKEIIDIEESIVYHQNKLTILNLKLEDLQYREKQIISYLKDHE